MGMQIEAGMWGEESPDTSDTVKNETPRTTALGGGAHAISSDTVATALSKFSFLSSALSQALHKDYRRYRAAGARSVLSVALTQGFWASAIFRVSHWALERLTLPGLGIIIKAVCLLLQKFI